LRRQAFSNSRIKTPTMHRMFKYRLYPSRQQENQLQRHLTLCKDVYNTLLHHYRHSPRLPSQYTLNKLLPALKQDNPEYASVHSQVLQNISKRIRDAYHGFFARRKSGLRAGRPRFKSADRYKSMTYPQSGFKVEGDTLNLSKIGSIRIRLHRPIRGDVKTLTVKRMPSGRWFAVFCCEVEAQPGEKPFEEVGVDLGLECFAALSDGTRIENPRYYRGSERRLVHLQRSLSRKEKGSRNHTRARQRVARLHEKVENRRSDFLHKASRAVADSYSTVYVEDLKIRNMVRNHRLAKSISDAGWGRFVGMLCYKEEESGGRVIVVNPRGTSQMCSGCGEAVVKSLSVRVHECPHCGLALDRDLNAARNILEIGRGPPESKPVERSTSTWPLEAGQVGSVKQEASLLVGM
jgi:putative transposase